MKTEWNEIHPINRRKLNTLQNNEIAEQLLYASTKRQKKKKTPNVLLFFFLLPEINWIYASHKDGITNIQFRI